MKKAMPVNDTIGVRVKIKKNKKVRTRSQMCDDNNFYKDPLLRRLRVNDGFCAEQGRVREVTRTPSVPRLIVGHLRLIF